MNCPQMKTCQRGITSENPVKKESAEFVTKSHFKPACNILFSQVKKTKKPSTKVARSKSVSVEKSKFNFDLELSLKPPKSTFIKKSTPSFELELSLRSSKPKHKAPEQDKTVKPKISVKY